MEKLNIAELLKNCPTGMELDCTIFDNVTFERVTHGGIWINYINNRNYKYDVYLDNEGCLPVSSLNLKTTKCVIFPKGKTTWEGFQRPFKDGDIIYNKFIQAVAIFCKQTDEGTISHCFLNRFKELKIKHYHSKFLTDWKLATEEEKQKLFDAIEMNGYKWNAETKTLEKLIEPKFKVGDKVKHKDTVLTIITVQTNNYIVEDEPDNFGILMFSQQDKWELINEPKFKVDDKIKLKGGDEFGIITEVTDCFYTIKNKNHTHCWSIEKQDDWELVVPVEPKFKVGDKIIRRKGYFVNPIEITAVTPKMYTFRDGSFQYVEIIDKDYELVSRKFDISSLKPFDKVLIRDKYTQKWCISFFSHYDKHGIYKYFCINGCVYMQCIPYKGNEYLCGKKET